MFSCDWTVQQRTVLEVLSADFTPSFLRNFITTSYDMHTQSLLSTILINGRLTCMSSIVSRTHHPLTTATCAPPISTRTHRPLTTACSSAMLASIPIPGLNWTILVFDEMKMMIVDEDGNHSDDNHDEKKTKRAGTNGDSIPNRLHDHQCVSLVNTACGTTMSGCAETRYHKSVVPLLSTPMMWK